MTVKGSALREDFYQLWDSDVSLEAYVLPTGVSWPLLDIFEIIHNPATKVVTVDCVECVSVAVMSSILMERHQPYKILAAEQGFLPKNAYSGKLVTFVVLKDNELEPDYCAGPVLMTTSSREADQILKTLRKGGGDIFVCDPWARSQLYATASVLHLVKPDEETRHLLDV